jgi:hypothetical protein
VLSWPWPMTATLSLLSGFCLLGLALIQLVFTVLG